MSEQRSEGLVRRMMRAIRPGAPAAPRAEVRDLSSFPVSSENFFEWLGLNSGTNMPPVTLSRALEVPAVAAALTFLPGELATLPLHLLKGADAGSEKLTGAVATMLQHAANPETSSFELRRLMWFHYFSCGRGLVWIERSSSGMPVALWNMDPAKTKVKREAGRKVYYFDSQREPYPASDVIDLVAMPKPDGLGHYNLLTRGGRAINDALALQEYSSRLFSKGGLPPLALEGVLPTTGPEAMKRALQQVKDAAELAAQMDVGIAQIPPGFKLTPIGVNPQDGQMVEAKRFAIEEIARLFGLPPVFLQDLTHGTFSNTEQQDLHLVKHRVVHLCVAFEQELNLKLFGPRANSRYVKHNIDGLLRGDFKSRMEGIVRGVQGGLFKPNEGRGLLDLPASEQPGADELHLQGATVPLGTQGDQSQ